MLKQRRIMQIQKSIKCDVATLLQTVLDTMKTLRYAENVLYPNPRELEQTAERYGVRTVYGNYNFASTVKNRSA
jgi:queuine/archaeosine tRNA-ribosyltransferase